MASWLAARLRKAATGGKTLEKQGAAAWQEVPAEMWCGHHVEPQHGSIGDLDTTEDGREAQTCHTGSSFLTHKEKPAVLSL